MNEIDASLTVMRNMEPQKIVERGKIIGRVVAFGDTHNRLGVKSGPMPKPFP